MKVKYNSVKLYLAGIVLLAGFACSKENANDPNAIANSDYTPQFSTMNGYEVPNQYILRLDGKALGSDLPLGPLSETVSVSDAVNTLLKANGLDGTILYVYEHAIKGVAIEMSEEAATILKNSPLVAALEKNKIVSIVDGFEEVETHGKKPKKKDGVEANGKGGKGGGKDKGGTGGGDGTDGGDGGTTDPDSGSGGGGKGKGGGKDKGGSGGGDGTDGGDGGTTDPGTDDPTTNQPDQLTPWGITRVGGSADGSGRTAWILDTGVDTDHPDLNVDLNRSRAFLSSQSGATVEDGDGHGTHVSGIVGALNNTIGVVGVAANANIVAVRVLNDNGNGSIADVLAGIDYVSANGQNGDIANLSLAGPASQTLDDAVVNAAAQSGVRFVIAAGNYAEDVINYSPGRANGTNVFTISAINANDVFGYFSNYGSAVDYTAPGVEITSTWLNGEYSSISGTSMSAPHFAGLLLTTNTINHGGTAINDQDNNPDIIAVR